MEKHPKYTGIRNSDTDAATFSEYVIDALESAITYINKSSRKNDITYTLTKAA